MLGAPILGEDRVAWGLCRMGRGMGWVGRELPSVGVPGPLAEWLYKSFQGGQPILFLIQAGLNALFCHDVFLFNFFFLFKRSMTKTT